MKIKTVLFLALFSCGCLDTFSQNKKQDDELLTVEEQSKEKHINNLAIQDVQVFEGANNSIINVVGNSNSHFINQKYGGGIDPNVANLNQLGNGNEAEITQIGSGINSTVIQDGNNNQYRGQITGTSNTSKALQDGNNNVIEQSLNGGNLNYELIQDGNNNQIIHSISGSQSGPPQIIQDGNNMNITIEQK